MATVNRLAITATQLLWARAGYPMPLRGKPQKATMRCAICGTHTNLAIDIGIAMPKATFTGFDALADSTSNEVCVACAWSMEGRPPNTFRMWSVVYREDGHSSPSNENAPEFGPQICLDNKSNPAPILDILSNPPRSGPWFCAIADSGKIHLLPYTPVNYGDGRWIARFERENVSSNPREFTRIVHHAAALLNAGFSKRDILSREPTPSRLAKLGIDIWRTNIEAMGAGRGGVVERLAVFLLRKKEKHDAERKIEETAYIS